MWKHLCRHRNEIVAECELGIDLMSYQAAFGPDID
jgi:hypothetical protein